MYGSGQNLTKLPVIPKVLVDFNSLKKLKEREQYCLKHHKGQGSDMENKAKETIASKQEDLQRSQEEQLKEKSYNREIVQSGASNKLSNDEDETIVQTSDAHTHEPLSLEASIHFLHFVPKKHVVEARRFLESLVESEMFTLSASGNLVGKDGTDFGNFVALMRHMFGPYSTEKNVQAVYSTLSYLLPNFSFRGSDHRQKSIKRSTSPTEEKTDWYKIL